MTLTVSCVKLSKAGASILSYKNKSMLPLHTKPSRCHLYVIPSTFSKIKLKWGH